MARKKREFEAPPEDAQDEPLDEDDDGLDVIADGDDMGDIDDLDPDEDDKDWDSGLDEGDLDDDEPSDQVALADDDGPTSNADEEEDDGEHQAEELMFEEAPAPKKKKTKKKRASKAKPKPPTKAAVRAAESVAARKRLWEAGLAKSPEEPQVYTITENYPVGHAISHKKFGLGVVEAALGGNKVEVLFESGRRKLVTNFKR